jgi:rubrerythrin
MNPTESLEAAIALELAFADCYEALSRSTPAAPIADDLAQMGREEVDHANLIRMERRFAAEMPDFFTPKAGLAESLYAGFEEVRTIPRAPADPDELKKSLTRLLEMEKFMEQIHGHAAASVEEAGLKKLFASLSSRDQGHVAELAKMIAGDKS